MAGAKKMVMWVHGNSAHVQSPEDVRVEHVGFGTRIWDTAKHQSYPRVIPGWPTGKQPVHNWIHFAIATPSGHLYKPGKKEVASAGPHPEIEAVLVRFRSTWDRDWGVTQFFSALTEVHIWDAGVKLDAFHNFNLKKLTTYPHTTEDFGLTSKDWTTEYFKLKEKRKVDFGIGISLGVRFDAKDTQSFFDISSVGVQFVNVP
jgi:hypothetical protein